MIVLLGGEKGGTGKTTLAINLVVMRAMKGRDVLLLDADPQESSSIWAEIRDDKGHEPHIPCLKKTGKKVHVELSRLTEKYQDIVVDTGGRDSAELRSAMVVSDLLVVPLRPGLFDVWATDKMATLVDEVKTINHRLKAVAIVNAASTNPNIKELEKVKKYFEEVEEIDLGESVIRERIAFRRSTAEGQAALEAVPEDRKAINEIQTLYGEVFGGA